MTPKQNEPTDRDDYSPPSVVDALEWCRQGNSLTQRGYDDVITLAKLQSEAVTCMRNIIRHCDVTSDGETAFERDVLAGQKLLRAIDEAQK